MLLSNLKRTSIGKKILIDENSIVLYVPSVSSNIWDVVYDSGFLLSNCRGIIIPNKIFKFNKKQFNGRIHYLDSKKNFLEKKNVIKKIPVLSSLSAIPTKDAKTVKTDELLKETKLKQFYLYDYSIIQNAIAFFQGKIPDKTLLQFFFDDLNTTYSQIKEEHPEKNVILIFDIQNKNDFFYHFFINFRQIKTFLKEELDRKFFDKFVFTAIHSALIPVLEYDKKNVLQPIFPMINKLESFLDTAELSAEIDGAPAIQDADTADNVDDVLPNKSIFSDIVQSLTATKKSFTNDAENKTLVINEPIKIKATPTDDDDIKVDLDGKALSKVMKFYKISNPDIIANTKSAIDDYIKETGVVPTKSNAEMLVLKAVSKSIHGTDEVDPSYLASPNLLFEKLKDVNVFSVPLNFPKDEKSFPFKIDDIVTLKSVTGQHRQKFEFTEAIHENIEKVFKTLELQKHPIKVLNISYDYVDNNIDRYTEYTINLQNTDGNKQKYTVKLNIPTVINEKYFKIGGNK